MLIAGLLVLLLVFFQAHCSVSNGSVNNGHVICVFENVNNCSSCTANYTDLADISVPTENFTIVFCSEDFHLRSVLTLADSHSVTVRGMPSKLWCKQDNTGIHLYNITLLVFQDLELVSCGSMYNDPSLRSFNHNAMQFRSGIYILNCRDITMERLAVIGSNGSGVVMFDNTGFIRISNCTFNKSSDSSSHQNTYLLGGSGLHIVLSYCSPRKLNDDGDWCQARVNHSAYTIEDCIFSGNIAGPEPGVGFHQEEHELIAEGFNRGGGLCVVIDTNSADNSVQVAGCTFTENSALWGGGLYITVVGDSANNTVHIENCTIFNNSCTYLAGGGVSVGYQLYQGRYPQGNEITLRNCSINENKASIGGGVTFYSSSSQNVPNRIDFVNCSWTGNVAHVGAAVDITPQIWKSYIYDMETAITFTDCRFVSNHLTNNVRTMGRYESHEKGGGAFLAVGYHIFFRGSLLFDNNTDSAMYLTSTEVEFCSNSNTTFSNNEGFIGGAIRVLGFSAILLNDGASLFFTGNTAVTSGGAIYQSSHDIRDFFASQSCFIRYEGTTMDVEKRNITLTFERNSIASKKCQNTSSTGADGYGRSIFASTIIPCHNCKNSTPGSTFNSLCIANFVFKDDNKYDVSTYGRAVSIKDNETVLAVPGKQLQLPIITLNDLSEEVLNTYHVTVYNFGDSDVSVGHVYTFISNKYLLFYGKPDDEADVLLETAFERTIVFKFRVKIQHCPPGFVHTGYKCVCSFDTHRKFLGIQSCDSEKFQAQLHPSYWVGYDNMVGLSRDEDLLHCICPLGHCLNQTSYDIQLYTLPPNTSSEALDAVVCGKARTGVLCSKCREGYASNYHDSKYNCKKMSSGCKWGWLLYIVSEIIPVTLFFIVVMVFNIKFVDGAVNGFILFAQIADSMLVKGNRFILFPNYSYIGLQAYRFITRIFNLNFFAIESFSFCLWNTASTLDLLAFKYITILYASTLVVVIIAVFKYCHSKKLNSFLVKMNGDSAASTKSAIIDGVSGFLVICYSECIRVSFLLLTPVRLYASNDRGVYVKRVVPFYGGDLVFFGNRHLFYALPALLIVFLVGILPPLMLMAYPLCYRVLTLLRIGETRFAKLLCKCVPLEKLKPFFDSFQSSYKDEYRFFSGLHFLYRFTTLATFAFSSNLNMYYILVQVQFAVILMVHASCQPYKKRWHNILDTLLFTNLSVVNAITLFNFNVTHDATVGHASINIASTVQVLLLYLPLLYITAYTIKKVIAIYLRKTSTKTLCLKLKRSRSNQLEPSSDYHQLSDSFLLDAVEERSE